MGVQYLADRTRNESNRGSDDFRVSPFPKKNLMVPYALPSEPKARTFEGLKVLKATQCA